MLIGLQTHCSLVGRAIHIAEASVREASLFMPVLRKEASFEAA